MTDIYDIKDIIVGFPISIWYTIIVCIIFFVLYILLFKFKSKNITSISDEKIETVDYIKIISEKDFINLDSKTFLREMSLIFRSFLEENKGYNNFSKLTLKEILKLEINIKYFEILQDIYYKEYKETKLDIKEKEKIYNNIKDIIVN